MGSEMLLLVFALALGLSSSWADILTNDYYLQTCPAAEGIIQRKMSSWFRNDSSLAPSIIRLHFHDCAVRGCDASVLLNHEGSERAAKVSRTLRGFNVIDDIKAELERRCPQTVSCADILTAAARDATVQLGGPFWEVPFGRKDGRTSIGSEAEKFVPQGRENVTSLIDFFQSNLGLSVLDLVVLSGSHTIGRSTCSSFAYSRSPRAAARNANVLRIDSTYLNRTRSACSSQNGKIKPRSRFVDLDVSTPKIFDVQYYANLGKNMGLLTTDQELAIDQRTAPFVSMLAGQPDLFLSQFSASMVKLGNIVLPSWDHGEVRRQCDIINA